MTRTQLHPAAREPLTTESAPDEIRLSDYVERVRARWRWLALGAIVGAAIGYALYASSPFVYSAVATLRVGQSKVGETPSAREGPADYVALVSNQSLVAEVLKELGLDRPPHNQTPDRFLTDVLRVEPVPASNLIRVRVRSTDPALAARAANRVAQRAIELGRRLSAEESVSARDGLGQRLEEARQRLDRAQATYEEFERASQIDLVRRDVEAMLDRRGDLLPLYLTLQGERAKLARAETDLAARSRIDTLRRSVDSDAQAAANTSAPAGDARPGTIKSEEINSVYERLDREVAETRTHVASLEKQWTELVQVRKLDGPKSDILTRLMNLESTQERLKLEREIAETVYKDVSTTYEKARLRVETGTAVLQLVDAALPPDRPVAPRRSANLAIGMTIGTLIAGLAALWGGGRRRPAAV